MQYYYLRRRVVLRRREYKVRVGADRQIGHETADLGPVVRRQRGNREGRVVSNRDARAARRFDRPSAVDLIGDLRDHRFRPRNHDRVADGRRRAGDVESRTLRTIRPVFERARLNAGDGVRNRFARARKRVRLDGYDLVARRRSRLDVHRANRELAARAAERARVVVERRDCVGNLHRATRRAVDSQVAGAGKDGKRRHLVSPSVPDRPVGVEDDLAFHGRSSAVDGRIASERAVRAIDDRRGVRIGGNREGDIVRRIVVVDDIRTGEGRVVAEDACTGGIDRQNRCVDVVPDLADGRVVGVDEVAVDGHRAIHDEVARRPRLAGGDRDFGIRANDDLLGGAGSHRRPELDVGVRARSKRDAAGEVGRVAREVDRLERRAKRRILDVDDEVAVAGQVGVERPRAARVVAVDGETVTDQFDRADVERAGPHAGDKSVEANRRIGIAEVRRRPIPGDVSARQFERARPRRGLEVRRKRTRGFFIKQVLARGGGRNDRSRADDTDVVKRAIRCHRDRHALGDDERAARGARSLTRSRSRTRIIGGEGERRVRGKHIVRGCHRVRSVGQRNGDRIFRLRRERNRLEVVDALRERGRRPVAGNVDNERGHVLRRNRRGVGFGEGGVPRAVAGGGALGCVAALRHVFRPDGERLAGEHVAVGGRVGDRHGRADRRGDDGRRGDRHRVAAVDRVGRARDVGADRDGDARVEGVALVEAGEARRPGEGVGRASAIEAGGGERRRADGLRALEKEIAAREQLLLLARQAEVGGRNGRHRLGRLHDRAVDVDGEGEVFGRGDGERAGLERHAMPRAGLDRCVQDEVGRLERRRRRCDLRGGHAEVGRARVLVGQKPNRDLRVGREAG